MFAVLAGAFIAPAIAALFALSAVPLTWGDATEGMDVALKRKLKWGPRSMGFLFLVIYLGAAAAIAIEVCD